MAAHNILSYSMTFHDILRTFMCLASSYSLVFYSSGDLRRRILDHLRSFAAAIESWQASPPVLPYGTPDFQAKLYRVFHRYAMEFHSIYSHARYAGGPTFSEKNQIFHLAFPAYLWCCWDSFLYRGGQIMDIYGLVSLCSVRITLYIVNLLLSGRLHSCTVEINVCTGRLNLCVVFFFSETVGPPEYLPCD